MNPVPISWCVAGGLALAVTAFVSGYQVNDWKRDSAELQQAKKQAKAVNTGNARGVAVAQAYEKDRADAEQAREARNIEIRTIYRDRVVRSDCAPDDAAMRLLESSIAAANERAAGKSASTLSADQAAAAAIRPAGEPNLGK